MKMRDRRVNHGVWKLCRSRVANSNFAAAMVHHVMQAWMMPGIGRRILDPVGSTKMAAEARAQPAPKLRIVPRWY